MLLPEDENDPVVDKEIISLLQAIFRQSGYDYRNYSFASIRRRMHSFIRRNKWSSVRELSEKVLTDQAQLHALLFSLSIPTTYMFRDINVFRAIREKIVPILRQSPLIKIWSAGCSTGEEAYSLAILLKEEHAYERTLLYATDVSERALASAKKAIYPLRRMRDYTSAYQSAGGKSDFSEYYSADSENAIMHSFLKQNIVFGQHNLVTDSSFNEFDLILCRNVLIYFNRDLQNQVLQLLSDSLRPGGFLILGDKESLNIYPSHIKYKDFDRPLRIYQKQI